jgi:hypothetical protein
MFYKEIKNKKSFLPSGFAGEDKPSCGKNKFWGMDSERLFKENLKIQPSDWYYRTHDVTYTVNSLGYRAPEFDQVDWKNSVVMFGCSTVFGDGVDDADTIPSQLSKIIGKPVINMGTGGSGIEWALHNSLILREFYPVPLAVVQVWSDPSRTLLYGPGGPKRIGNWSGHPDNSFFNIWNKEGNSDTYAYFIRLAAKHIWNNVCIFHDVSWSPEMVEISSCSEFPLESRTPNTPAHLMARDLCHQSPIPLLAMAKDISISLKEKGLCF